MLRLNSILIGLILLAQIGEVSANVDHAKRIRERMARLQCQGALEPKGKIVVRDLKEWNALDANRQADALNIQLRTVIEDREIEFLKARELENLDAELKALIQASLLRMHEVMELEVFDAQASRREMAVVGKSYLYSISTYHLKSGELLGLEIHWAQDGAYDSPEKAFFENREAAEKAGASYDKAVWQASAVFNNLGALLKHDDGMHWGGG